MDLWTTAITFLPRNRERNLSQNMLIRTVALGCDCLDYLSYQGDNRIIRLSLSYLGVKFRTLREGPDLFKRDGPL